MNLGSGGRNSLLRTKQKIVKRLADPSRFQLRVIHLLRQVKLKRSLEAAVKPFLLVAIVFGPLATLNIKLGWDSLKRQWGLSPQIATRIARAISTIPKIRSRATAHRRSRDRIAEWESARATTAYHSVSMVPAVTTMTIFSPQPA